MVAPFLPDEDKVAAIRAELVATGAGIYLDAASAGPLSAEADRAMREWADWELRVGRAGDDTEAEFHVRVDEARGTIAAILVAAPERVVLAPSVALAMHLAAESRRLRPGDRILAAGSLEASVRASLLDLAGAVGAELEVVDSLPRDAGAPFIERLRGTSHERVALVVVPHVSPVDGSLTEVAELADLAHRAGAWLAVDGSLGAGAFAIDVPGLGADIYALAADRWLLGPSGTAAAYLAVTVRGSQTGGDAAHGAGLDDFNRAAVVGLGRSVGWLAMQVGLEWAHARGHHLFDLVAELLGRIAGLSFLAPPDTARTILAFRLDGWPATTLRDELGRRVFAVVGLNVSADAVRVSVGWWNTEEELRRFCETVDELAAIRPEQIVRRPPILVLPADPPGVT
jgi:selenocysteine lyase/cysteine desulfurase